MQRKKYSPQFKAYIALEVVKGLKTINEIASDSGVHPTQIQKWKKYLLEELPQIFNQGSDRSCKDNEELTAQLYNHKRVARLIRLLGVETIYPRPKLSRGEDNHRKYPYLLADLTIDVPNQVWCSDITYIRMPQGFVYLVAIMDWYSRFVLAWQLSNTLDVHFCLEALESALRWGQPQIFNSDQGSQYTCGDFISRLEQEGIQVSHDGRGRVFDNIFVERLWRTLKYEEVYLKDYETISVAQASLSRYFQFYNYQRLHQALGYQPPALVHFSLEGGNVDL